MHNQHSREWREKVNAVWTRAKESVRELAKEIETLRGKLLKGFYEAALFQERHERMEQRYSSDQEKFEKLDQDVHAVFRENEKSIAAIQHMEQELQDCAPWQFWKKAELQSRIADETTALDTRREYLKNSMEKYGYETTEQFREAFQQHKDALPMYEEYVREAQRLSAEKEQLLEKISEMKKYILTMSDV